MMRLLCFVFFFSFWVTASASAGVAELRQLSTLDFEKTPLQIAPSSDGRRLYVMTDDHQLQIYTLAGDLQGQVVLDPQVDQFVPLGPQHLLLQKSAQKQASIALIEISQNIDISAAPVLGDENAPVTIAVFDDFECPYCAQSVPLFKQVLDIYPGKVKLVFKNFPLSSHRNAQNAAITALAAQRQGKFWEMHDLLFANYNKLNPQKIDELAAEAGLDLDQLKKDRKDPQLSARIKQDIDEGTAAGVRGTPTVFVNGRLLPERSLNGFRQLIDDELARLEREKQPQ
jgi:protein-disulfide isomerase